MSHRGMPLATILVADDSEDNRELLANLLVSRGYRVVCAEDGAQALEAATTQLIDLALLDVVMRAATASPCAKPSRRGRRLA